MFCNTGEKQYPPNVLQAAFGVRLDISIQREQQPSCCSAIPFSLRVTRRRRKLTIASPAPKLFTRRRRRLRLLPRHPRRLVVNTNALQRSNRPRINPRGASATWLSGAVRAEINCSSRTVPHLMRDLFKEPPTLNPSPQGGGKQGQRHHNSHRPTFVNALRRFQEKVRILWHGVLGTGISFVKKPHRRACRRMDRSARQSWLDKLTMRLGEAQKLPPRRLLPLARHPGFSPGSRREQPPTNAFVVYSGLVPCLRRDDGQYWRERLAQIR